MGLRNSLELLELLSGWAAALPPTTERADIKATLLIIREADLNDRPTSKIREQVHEFYLTERDNLSSRGFLRLATADILAGGKHGVDICRRTLRRFTLEGPFICPTPDGPTFWCRPLFSELLCLVRDLGMQRSWPGAVDDILQTACESEVTGAFHLETCIGSAGEFIRQHVSENLLELYVFRSQLAAEAWLSTCVNLLATFDASGSQADFVTQYRNVQRLLLMAQGAFASGAYSDGYTALSEAIDALRGVTPVLRHVLDWALASTFEQLEHSERVSLLQTFLIGLPGPSPRWTPHSVALLETVDRLLHSFFGYPRLDFGALQVHATRGAPGERSVHSS